MTTLVVDSSIVIKWVVEEEGTAEALVLHNCTHLLAPELLVAECTHILWKKVQKNELLRDEALLAARVLERADIEILPTRALLSVAARIAMELGHPAYGCLYLALALDKDCRFVTADQRFLRRLAQGPEFFHDKALSLPRRCRFPLELALRPGLSVGRNSRNTGTPSVSTTLDPVIRDLWHVAYVAERLPAGAARSTTLFERRLSLTRALDGTPAVADETGRLLPVLERYGFLWTSFGEPKPLFEIPEYDEPDRKNVCTGSVGIRVSAPRAIENFLDMGHFPFVHTGLLGEEPHTEVKEYTVAIDEAKDEVVATECRFWQPQAAAASTGGAEVEYIYRVPHPFCAVLYKTSAPDPARFDAIALFVQPVAEERVIGHPMMSLVDDVSTVGAIRHFQLTIFGQDKPILENQQPRRLPLDPRAETPIRADKSSIAYRRWLTAKGLRYGVVPAAA